MYKVNLLPPKLQREGIIDVRRLVLITGTTLVIAVMLGTYGAFLINYLSLKNDLAATKQQLASLEPVVLRVEKMRNERTELEAVLDEYNSILKKRMTWTNLLFDFNRLMPIDSWLTELEISSRNPPEQKAGGDSPAQTAPKTTVKPEGQAQAQKEADTLPRANMITFKGFSRTVPSIGIFMNNLSQLACFKEIKLIKINREKEGLKFEINAYLKDVS